MRLVENYNGATLRLRFDRHTDTYLGFIDGLDVTTSVQATTYGRLVEAFHEAVDTYIEERFALKQLEVQRARETSLKSVTEGETLKISVDDDPYSRRQFIL